MSEIDSEKRTPTPRFVFSVLLLLAYGSTGCNQTGIFSSNRTLNDLNPSPDHSPAPSPKPSASPQPSPSSTAGPCTYPSAWETVNDYVYSATAVITVPTGFTSDSFGNIYSSAYTFGLLANGQGSFRWLVRKSTDHGVTWATVDDYQYPGGTLSITSGITSDKNGNIYVVGNGNDATPTGHWITRKSTDHGATWTNIDDVADAEGAAVAIDSAGSIFVAGSLQSGSLLTSGLGIRKSVNQGVTWTTVNYDNTQPNPFIGVTGIAIDPKDNIYVSANTFGVASTQYGLVRESSDHGTTWTTIDDFNFTLGQATNTDAVFSDSFGNIFASGFYAANSTTAVSTPFIRKRGVGTSTFVTLSEPSARTFAEDSLGNLLIATDGLVKKSLDHGATWSIIDNFAYAPGTAFPTTDNVVLGRDTAGSVYVESRSSTAGVGHDVARRWSCN